METCRNNRLCIEKTLQHSPIMNSLVVLACAVCIHMKYSLLFEKFHDTTGVHALYSPNLFFNRCHLLSALSATSRFDIETD